jgi:lysyl-tRNA synthetase class 1
MEPMGAEDEMPGEDLERWITEVCQASAATALQRIEDQCLLSEALLHRLVMVDRHDSSLAQKILDFEFDIGAAEGTLRRYETRALLQLAGQTLRGDGFRLHYALRRAIDVYRLTSVRLVERINRKGIFGNDTALLLQGVGAWLKEDHVKALHVLVPQIERGVRELLSPMGISPAWEAAVNGRTDHSIALGCLLYRESAARRLGRDLRLHLLTFFDEAPGWNLGNRMMRGRMPAEEIHEGVTNWLLHALLVLGQCDGGGTAAQ